MSIASVSDSNTSTAKQTGAASTHDLVPVVPFVRKSSTHRLGQYLNIRRVLQEALLEPLHAAPICFVQLEVETTEEGRQTYAHLEI